MRGQPANQPALHSALLGVCAVVGAMACVAPGTSVALDYPLRDPEPSAAPPAGPSTPATPTEPSDQTGARRTRARGQLDRAQLAALGIDACIDRLRASEVAVEALSAEQHPGIDMPVRIHGSIDGIVVELRGHDAIHDVLDCRLAVALLAWAPRLRAHGVTRIEHYSMYRPGARTGRRRKVSGHARGLAIDAARFHFEDGSVRDVLTDWGAHERGVDPCLGDVSDDEDRTLREMVCEVVAEQLFSVVLTPHHDAAHANHVHLELVPEVSWSYVR